MGDRVNQDEIKQANDVHVLDYLNSKGEDFVKQGKYFRHAEHDSLIINENGKWFWNSRGEGGFGAISFARAYYDMTFQDAVRDVNGQSITRSYANEVVHQESKEFSYPKQYEAITQRNIKQYLVNERVLDEKTVEALIKRDLVAEDKLKNCVFKWKDSDGRIVGGDRQGTVKMENKRGSFKQIMANSKEDGGFRLDIGKPNKIALFESPIDALSYFDLHKPKDIRLQSMSGLKDQAATSSIKELIRDCRKENIQVEKVIIAVDNDKAGVEFTERWMNLINIGEVHKPKYKDWNIDLKAIKNVQKEKEHSMSKQSVEIER